ncbi:CBS domain-containing protein [Methanobacterium sp. ACI-7]|uniref:CBS domain-containing protein n=1 Tax=unclassified Methanobacterium TaxID=2627676 RepID=UPI0039C3C9E1
MITVEEAMQKDVIKFKDVDTISYVANVLREKKISGAPIVDDSNKVMGIVSEGDIMRLIEVHSPNVNLILPSPLDLIELPVRMRLELDELAEGVTKAGSVLIGEIMTKKVYTVKKDASISDAAKFMDKHNINRLPVVDDNDVLTGIITRGDIIGALVKKDE